MRQVFSVVLVLLGVSSCAGFRAVERGEWVLVFVDPAKRGGDAPREVVSRDAYEREVTAGVGRMWEPPPGYVFPLLHETDAVGLKVGEVAGFRVDEATAAELLLDGAGLDVFWGPMKKRDEWREGNDVTVRESPLYVRATKAGKATLRLVRGTETKDVPVTVK